MALIAENVTIRDKEFIHTYSDKNNYGLMDNNGIIYKDAYDLTEYPKEYTEVKLENEVEE